MFGLLSPLGIAVVVLYFYVGVAIVRAETKAGATMMGAVAKAAVWPATIWHTIEKLYLS